MRNIPLWVRIVGGVFLFLFALMLISPNNGRARMNARRSQCQTNLRQIVNACQQYASDADGRFPPISTTHDEGWYDLLSPYLEHISVFHCPEGYSPSDERQIDYFYNARLARLSAPKHPQLTIIFGDGKDNAGPDAHLRELPQQWKADFKEANAPPSRRHLYGANYAFVDGHVKFVKPTSIFPDANQKAKVLDYTFVVHK